MKISLSPTRHETPLNASRKGDVLTLNGTKVDLSTYRDGDNPWISGQPEKKAGEWSLTLVLPHGAKAPAETLFPKLLRVAGDGRIALPIYETPVTVDVEEVDGPL